MNIDDKRLAIKEKCHSYEDCIDGCPLWKHSDRCYTEATDEEIERNYARMFPPVEREIEHCKERIRYYSIRLEELMKNADRKKTGE